MVRPILYVGRVLVSSTVVLGWEHVSGDAIQTSIENHDVSVVAFVFPSDKRSEHLELEWPANTRIFTASVDCEADSPLCNSHGVASSPLLKLFSKGEAVSTYRGPRRAAAISAWIDRAQRPAISEVTAESLEEFKRTDEVIFLAYLSADDERSREALLEIATQYHEEFTFGLVTDVAVIEAEKVTAPVISCIKPIDNKTHEHHDFAMESLEGFIKEASRPIIAELLPHNHQRFLQRGWPMVYLFATTERERSEFREAFRKTARAYYEALTMVTVDPLEFPDLPGKLGLEPDVFPSGAVHQLSKNKIYHYPRDQGLTPNELASWGFNVWQGRIKPWSPPGSATSDDGTGGRIKATRSVSMNKIPGVNIRVNGHDEL